MFFHCAIVPWNVMEFREEQCAKAPDSIMLTLLGIVTEVSFLQYSKAPSSIIPTLSGIVIDVSDEQPAKALYPILVTPLGMMEV